MRRVIAERVGGPEVLQTVQVPVPEPGFDEILIQTEASGVNFTDIWLRLGADGEPPLAPGVEVSGTVVAVGPSVETVRIGDRVAATPYHTRGAYSEFVVAPISLTYPIPDGVDAIVAAALPLNYLTAYAAVEHAVRPRPGERVLVHAAAGGVGLAAVQLARRHGVELYGTASAAKHAVLREEGVEHPIDYRSTDWVKEIMRRTGDGVDVVLDGVGEAAYRRSLEVTRFGGRVVAYGYSAGVPSAADPPADLERELAGALPLLSLLAEARSIMGVHLAGPVELIRGWWTDLVDMLARGEISPRIDQVYNLEEAAKAHQRLHDRANIGKIVLVP
ncbi:MAG TPA: zinc-binding dehydrogenase [Actinomycetes bacterium]|jgi:NADPH:quinone reductase-like Zn-dependent oxidoreductase|nr:zinc-binding dehydrogenase [Actinomycetes bacterium]